MTLQKIFNKVRDHLLKQNEQARSNGMCVYRTSEGKMCAAGCLIREDLYDPAIENYSITSTDSGGGLCEQSLKIQRIIAASLGLAELSEEAINLIGRLQGIHDGTKPEGWLEALQIAARDHNLEY